MKYMSLEMKVRSPSVLPKIALQLTFGASFEPALCAEPNAAQNAVEHSVTSAFK